MKTEHIKGGETAPPALKRPEDQMAAAENAPYADSQAIDRATLAVVPENSEPASSSRLRNFGRGLMALAGISAVALATPALAEGSADIKQHTDGIISEMSKLQNRSTGHFREPTGRKSRYGDAMLAYGFLLKAKQTDNSTLARRGYKALISGTKEVDKGAKAVRPLGLWPIAATYNVIKGDKSRPARTAKNHAERFLKRQKLVYLQGDSQTHNKKVAEAVGVLEALKTGVESKKPGTILWNDGKYARNRALKLINQRMPASAARSSEAFLSDPQAYPQAYGALVYGLYARAIELRGNKATGRNWSLLQKMGRTIGKITAPDGSVAQWGRSMENPWVGASSAYGATVATKAPGSSSAADKVNYSLADRQIKRIKSVGVGPEGKWLTPALRQNFLAGLKGEDPYVRLTEYRGIELVKLLLAQRKSHKIWPGKIPADSPMQAVVSQGTGRTAVMRKDNRWLAVKEKSNGESGGIGDLRYDTGAVAFKILRPDGIWTDVTPLRAMGGGSAGPVMMTPQGRPAYFSGNRINPTADGKVIMTGNFVLTSGQVVKQGATVVTELTPEGRCASTGVYASPGERFQFSRFFRRIVNPEVRNNAMVSGNQLVIANFPINPNGLTQGLSSASDPFITEKRFATQSRTSQWLKVADCYYLPQKPATYTLR